MLRCETRVATEGWEQHVLPFFVFLPALSEMLTLGAPARNPERAPILNRGDGEPQTWGTRHN
jgi:hypothetical protein